MKRPTRKEFSAVLAPALIKALDGLDIQQDAVTLLRAMRAVLHLMFDLAEAGACDSRHAVETIQRVAAERLPRLRSMPPAINMPKAKA